MSTPKKKATFRDPINKIIKSKRYKSRMDYITKFNIINQTELEKQHLLCAGCNDWLTSPILHVHRDCANYCEDCSKSSKLSGVQNHVLEEMLAKFRSMHEECEYVSSANDVKIHMKCCPYRPVNCLLCKEGNFHADDILTHLCDKHTDRVSTLEIDQPVADFTLVLPLSNPKLYIVKLNRHRFMLIVTGTKGTLSFKVLSVVDSVPNDSCMIALQCDNTEIRLTGTICNIHQSDKMPEMNVFEKSLKSKKLCMKLYFCGFELAQKVDDCLICFKQLTADIFQCSNGHSVCDQCIHNIDKCM